MAVPAGGTATLCPRIGGAFACLSAVLLPLAICAALPGNHTHAGGTTTDVAAKSATEVKAALWCATSSEIAVSRGLDCACADELQSTQSALDERIAHRSCLWQRSRRRVS